MEESRGGVESVLQKQDYSAFIKRQLKRKQQANADQVNTTSARDFNTSHSFYLHDHTLNPHSIIHSTSNEKSYDTITEGKLPKTTDRHALESGSDCDVMAKRVADAIGCFSYGCRESVSTRCED